MFKKTATLILTAILAITVFGNVVKADERSYAIYDDTTHGSVKFYVDGEQVTSAKEGDTVTLEINIDDGFELYGVMNYSNNIYSKVSENDGTYSFTMPARSVTLAAILNKTILHMGNNSIDQGGNDRQFYIFTPDQDGSYIFQATTDSPTGANQYIAVISIFDEKEDVYDCQTIADITRGFTLELEKDRTYYMYMQFLGFVYDSNHVEIDIAYGEYNAEFDSEGGSPVAGQRNAVGTPILRPDDPEKEGYDFAGWFEMITTGGSNEFVRYDFSLPVYEDKTLYAKWIVKSHEDAKYGNDTVVADKPADEFTDMDNYGDKILVLEADNGIVIVYPNVHHSGHIWPMISDYEPKITGLEALMDKAAENFLTEFYLEIEKTDANENITNDCDEKGYTVVGGTFFDAHMMMSVQNGSPYRYPADLGLLKDISLTMTLNFASEDIVFPTEKAGYKRTYYVAHYDGSAVEYLPLDLDEDKETGTFTTTSLSPFAVVYKDVRNGYVVPDTSVK